MPDSGTGSRSKRRRSKRRGKTMTVYFCFFAGLPCPGQCQRRSLTVLVSLRTSLLVKRQRCRNRPVFRTLLRWLANGKFTPSIALQMDDGRRGSAAVRFFRHTSYLFSSWSRQVSHLRHDAGKSSSVSTFYAATAIETSDSDSASTVAPDPSASTALMISAAVF